MRANIARMVGRSSTPVRTIEHHVAICLHLHVVAIGRAHVSKWSRLFSFVVASATMLVFSGVSGQAAETQVQRGKYLVSVIPCTDCHTPGTFLGKPDMKRYLGGSDVGFEVPGLGVFYGPNLTPDDETGLGKWTKEQIATAITTGKRPDGRILAPPMP